MTAEELIAIGRAVFGLAIILGPLVGLLELLNLRDRRQARVLHTVLHEVSSGDLRGRVAVQARCGLLSPRSEVTVDVLACSRNEIWEIMTRLSRRLSPHVRLEVTGPGDPYLLATFTFETTGRPRLPQPSQPSLATN